MSKTDKLLKKLINGAIDAKELRTLITKFGWVLDRQNGSHEQWLGPNKERMTIATHGKDLKLYQVKLAQSFLLKERKGK